MMPTNFYRRVLVVFLLYSFVCSPWLVARADEGMWTFANPPLKQLKEKYSSRDYSALQLSVALVSTACGSGRVSSIKSTRPA
ncbi:MAG TPA: hypothetical protein VGC64_10170 [Pyrinomonadaceae bacterium]